MSEKKNFMLRISPEMYAALEKWAADEFRSVNGQVEFILHNALKGARRLKNERPTQDAGNSGEKP